MKNFYPKFEHEEPERPTEGYLEGFKERLEVHSKKGSSLEADRAKFCTVDIVQHYFDGTYIKLYGIGFKSILVFNMDESMIISNYSHFVIIPKSASYAPIMQDPSMEHITLVSCISAEGTSLTSTIIFNHKTIPSLLSAYVKNGIINISGQKKGWMTKEIFLDWIKWFIKQVNDKRKKFGLPLNTPAMLVLDGHSSRLCPESWKLLKENYIHCTTLPAHTSHVLQPLDRSVFGPFKVKLKSELSKNHNLELKYETEQKISDRQIRRCRIVISMINAWQQSATTQNIQHGFEKTGLYPLNVELVLTNEKITKSAPPTQHIEVQPKKMKLKMSGVVLTSDDFSEKFQEYELAKTTQKK